jgi:hypothetical protein
VADSGLESMAPVPPLRVESLIELSPWLDLSAPGGAVGVAVLGPVLIDPVPERVAGDVDAGGEP